MKADLLNQKGKVIESLEINDEIFNSEVNDKVLSQYVYIYLSNQREGNANVKDKSEVSGGGKKPWKQKGTGRARVGSSRSPIWRGGGITHGPTSEVNWKKKTTRSFRKSAIINALSKVQKSNMIKFIDSVAIDSTKPMTKQAIDILKAFETPKKVSIVLGEKNSEVLNSFSNIKNTKVIVANELNAYDVLNSGLLVLDKKAVDYITNTWGK